MIGVSEPPFRWASGVTHRSSAAWRSYLQAQRHTSLPPWSGSKPQQIQPLSPRIDKGEGMGATGPGRKRGLLRNQEISRPERREPPVSRKTNVRGHLFRPPLPAALPYINPPPLLFSTSTQRECVTQLLRSQRSPSKASPRVHQGGKRTRRRDRRRRT